MSKFGVKIKNLNATQLYEVNLNTRCYFSQKDAMLNNSLFSDFLKKNGLDIYRKKKRGRKKTEEVENHGKHIEIIECQSDDDKESTRDIICLSFSYGTKSYEDDVKHLKEQLRKAENNNDEDLIAFFTELLDKANKNKDNYEQLSSDELRDRLYNNGISITYIFKDKKGNESKTTINYKMLYRTAGKAKCGQVFFINEKLYDATYDWLTMGLGNKLDSENAKIVELSAYAPLVTSSIVDRLHIPVEDILILKDIDSFFKTKSKIVKAQEYIDSKGKVRKKCIVEDGISEVKNTLWDGMALIESDITPKDSNGMVLLRNHMFKACAFKTYIQKFFKDWCSENGYDYDTYTVADIFGKEHKLKDIKVITTDNAIKWKKFVDIMGGTLESAYDYWCDRVNADGSIFGIVKTDHESKMGDSQRLSYQMVNSLPCTKQDIKEIAQYSLDYIDKLKNDADAFEDFLRKNANDANSYEMLADIYAHSKEFKQSFYFKSRRSQIISGDIIRKMRKGKVYVNGDNLTICGNPYALLLYSVGDNYLNDITLQTEEGTIQCYTERFDNNEFLCGFRNPHNAPNNICYLHNIKHPLMRKYFNFSKNIIAVNTIGTDIQSRANGCDYDLTNWVSVQKCA